MHVDASTRRREKVKEKGRGYQSGEREKKGSELIVSGQREEEGLEWIRIDG